MNNTDLASSAPIPVLIISDGLLYLYEKYSGGGVKTIFSTTSVRLSGIDGSLFRLTLILAVPPFFSMVSFILNTFSNNDFSPSIVKVNPFDDTAKPNCLRYLVT